MSLRRVEIKRLYSWFVEEKETHHEWTVFWSSVRCWFLIAHGGRFVRTLFTYECFCHTFIRKQIYGTPWYFCGRNEPLLISRLFVFLVGGGTLMLPVIWGEWFFYVRKIVPKLGWMDSFGLWKIRAWILYPSYVKFHSISVSYTHLTLPTILLV